MMRILAPWLLALGVLPAAAPAQPIVDRQLAVAGFEASDLGLRYLRSRQAEDGSWGGSVADTALALRAFLGSYRGYNESDGAFITRPVVYLLAHARPDGSIGEETGDRVLDTALAAVALQATGNPDFTGVVANARAFLIRAQADEGEGVGRDRPGYGSLGSGADGGPHLPIHYRAVEALRAIGLDAGDPLWAKARRFAGRLQRDDGGFAPAPGEDASRSATHAGLAVLLHAGAGRDDPDVRDAWMWIRRNYALDFAGGGTDDVEAPYRGLLAFADSMRAFGAGEVVGADGGRHNWRDDLVAKLLALRAADGVWGGDPGADETRRVRATALAVGALNHFVHSLR